MVDHINFSYKNYLKTSFLHWFDCREMKKNQKKLFSIKLKKLITNTISSFQIYGTHFFPSLLTARIFFKKKIMVPILLHYNNSNKKQHRQLYIHQKNKIEYSVIGYLDIDYYSSSYIFPKSVFLHTYYGPYWRKSRIS